MGMQKISGLDSKDFTQKTVMGSTRRLHNRSMEFALCPDGYKVAIESIVIDDIGYTKKDGLVYIDVISEEFGWDPKIKEHLKQDQTDKPKKIHMLLGLKNCSVMMEPIWAEQLNCVHPATIPDIGIWRSSFSDCLMITGRVGISSDLLTKDKRFKYIHETMIK